jgi:Flp pilus assembly protein TadD
VSVIYATLERLESEQPALADKARDGIAPSVSVESRGFPTKMLAVAIGVVLAGVTLMSWQQSEQPAVVKQIAPHAAASEYVEARKAERLAPVVTVGVPVPVAATAPVDEAAGVETAVVAPAEVVQPATGTRMEERVAVVSEPEPDIAAAEEVVAEPPPARESVQPVATVAVEESDPPAARPATVSAEPVEPVAKQQVAWAAIAPQYDVENAIEEARQALSRGRYYQALSTLEQLDPVPENRADVWLITGSAHLGIGQLDRAEAAFASARALAPDNAQIAVQQAILRQEQGDHPGALEILNAAAARHPNVPEIYLNKGYSEQALGGVREAQRSFRIFLQLTEARSLYDSQRQVVQGWLVQVSAVP